LKNFETKANGMAFHDVAPLPMKRGIMISEVIRAGIKNTTNDGLKENLNQISEKYSSLNFPQSMIHDVMKFDRKTSQPKTDWAKERKDNLDRNFTLKIPFTSPRVEKVAKAIRFALRKLTPNYNVLLAHKTINIRNTVVKFLKPKPVPLKTINCVYQFECPCGVAKYIGETEQILKERIKQHGNSQDSTIFQHISQCTKYLNARTTEVPNPNTHSRLRFLETKFKVLHAGLEKNERELVEALEISLQKPILNIQVAHRKVLFV
jgi:hypothetical protein